MDHELSIHIVKLVKIDEMGKDATKHILNYIYQAYWSQHWKVCVITWFQLQFYCIEKGILQHKDSCFLTKFIGWN